MRNLAAALVVSLALAGAARAGVLKVPGDFPTIQAAVDASAPGDTILIASGTYTEGVTLSGLSDRVLRGQGKVELTNDTVEPGVSIVACTNITVERLRFRELSAGIVVNGSTNVVLSRCRAELMDEVGFVIFGGQEVLLDRCSVDGALDGGVSMLGGTGATLRRCTLRNVGFGVILTDVLAMEVDRLRVEHVSGDALLIGGNSRSVDVHHARLLDVGDAGIEVQGDDNRIRQSLIVGPDGQGVLCTAAAERNVLDHVRVVGSGGVAFELGGASQEAHGCRAVIPAAAGFGLGDAGPHLVQDCRVLKPDIMGLIVTAGVNPCTLLDNRVTQAGAHGLSTTRDNTTISGNVVTGAAGDGIQIDSNLNLVTGNKAHGSGGFDLNEVTAGSSIFLDNSFGTEQHP